MRTSKRRARAILLEDPEPKNAPLIEIDTPVSVFEDTSLYINRELSLLTFQTRVLEEAQDETNPLLERVKFLSILGSNLDEFFMVRVAGLLAQVDAGSVEAGPDGMSPSAQLVAIRREVKKLLVEAHKWWRDLLLELADSGVHVLEYSELNEKHQRAADEYFRETIFPVLTPLAFDPGRPFPHISNRSLNLAVLIRDKDGQDRFARLKVPNTLPAVRSARSQSQTDREAPPSSRNTLCLAGAGNRGKSECFVPGDAGH